MNYPLNRHFLVGLVFLFILSSCVKKKDFLALQGNRDTIQQALDATKAQLAEMESAKNQLEQNVRDLEGTVASQTNNMSSKDSKIASLNDAVSMEKAKGEAFFNGLSDLSLLSDSESKQLKETLTAMEGIPSGRARKDSASVALVSNLKRSLGNAYSDDIQIRSKGSVIYITISDKVFFNTGRSELNGNSKFVLSNVAKVLKEHKSIDVLVEGHTDSDPIAFTSNKDNWDLSIKRAVAVVRSLQQDYEINPARLVPTGRAEFKPKGANETTEGKRLNRRTEIILVPRIDQYLRLITGK